MISVSRRSAKLKMVLRFEAKEVGVSATYEQDIIAMDGHDSKFSDMIADKDDASVDHGGRSARVEHDALKFQGRGRRR
jgi:hypothetical protein